MILLAIGAHFGKIRAGDSFDSALNNDHQLRIATGQSLPRMCDTRPDALPRRPETTNPASIVEVSAPPP